MATYTPNYNLKKPSSSDVYDIADANGNMDTIDTQLKSNADAIAGKQNTITGGATTIVSSNLTASRALVSSGSGKIIVSSTRSGELNALHGIDTNVSVQEQINGKQNILTFDTTPTADSTNPVTSGGIKTALDGKQSAITGSASSVVSTNLTASKVLVTNSSKKIAVSTLDSSKLDYLANVTSDIQTQLDAKTTVITGGASSIVSHDLDTSKILVSNASGKVDASSVGSGKLTYLANVTSDIQSQINGKQSTIGGGATSIVSNNLTVDRALISNGSGKVAISDITSTELGYLDNVTSNIQTQLNGKAPTNHASQSNTYGLGTANNYGHVKLSDSVNSTDAVSSGKATTPKAVNDAISKIFTKSTADLTTYIRFGGIMIMCIRQVINSKTGTITLPISFKNSNYVVSITPYTALTDNVYVAHVTGKTVNTINFLSNLSSGVLEVMAIGEI